MYVYELSGCWFESRCCHLTLTRIVSYLNPNHYKSHVQLIFKGQFSYCPFIRIFCSRRSNHLINKLQEQTLRRVYNNYNSSFSDLIEMTKDMTKHIRNLKFLLTEICKFLNSLFSPIMNQVFQINYFFLI